MYSRVKRRRKSLRRNSYGIQNHHEVSTEGEEEGKDGIDLFFQHTYETNLS